MALHISKTVKTYPTLPYKRMAESILGKSYDLSLVFIGEHRAQTLNKKYRRKTYAPDVLSFPLGKQAGEIFITPQVAERKAKKFNHSPRTHIGYLFIHGLLHLKGYDHGATMEKAEKKYLAQFKLK